MIVADKKTNAQDSKKVKDIKPTAPLSDMQKATGQTQGQINDGGKRAKRTMAEIMYPTLKDCD